MWGKEVKVTHAASLIVWKQLLDRTLVRTAKWHHAACE